MTDTQVELRQDPASVKPSERLVSLDVLRGFDMFWIIGADAVFRSLTAISDQGALGALATQFKHVRFEGFRFYDLIFPLFVFIIGVSLVYSLDKHLEKQGKRGVYARIFRRFVLLFLLGVFYDHGVAEIAQENVLCGVLQRLALCYFFTSLLYVHLKLRGLVTVFFVILIGYWVLFCFVPVPGTGEIGLTRDMNWTKYIDLKMPPYYDDDPEGYLSTVPAVASCLLGVFAGLFLKRTTRPEKQRAGILVVAGLLMLLAGYLWGFHFPVAKRVWTSSYVFVAGGYSLMLLGLFYLIVDVWKWRRWATPFVWIGMNPITIYMAHNIIDFDELGERLVGGPISGALGDYGAPLPALAGLLLSIMAVWWLHERRIFIRV